MHEDIALRQRRSIGRYIFILPWDEHLPIIPTYIAGSAILPT